MKPLYSLLLGEEHKQELVILHGFLGAGSNWKTFAKKWADKGLKVHLVDQRNHGQSFWDDEFNYEVLIEDLANYYKEKKIESAFLLGHSMGGKTAMGFASKFPEKVEKLIIADMAPKRTMSRHKDILKALYCLTLQPIRRRSEAKQYLEKYVPAPSMQNFLLKSLYYKSKDEMALRINIKVLREKAENVYKNIEGLEPVNIPSLFLRGELSDYVLDEDLPTIKKYFPNSTICTIEDAGHWLHGDNPNDFLEHVNPFLFEN